MNQSAFPAANCLSRPSLSLAMTIAMPLIVVAANAFGIASASAQELHTPGADTPRGYDDAVHALTAQRYSVAYSGFAALADQGHAPSALMALAIVSYRPSVSGPQWSATPAQLQRWSTLVAREVPEINSLIAEYRHGD
jgi:hypothetical protein